MVGKNSLGLVLSGGGARGAYQAGVLLALGEILSSSHPLSILSGVSAGAVNAAFIASSDQSFNKATEKLCDLWRNIESDEIFRTDFPTLGKLGVRLMTDLTLGGFYKRKKTQALLDTHPLRTFLQKNISISQLKKNLKEGWLKALALTAVDYKTSKSITFVESNQPLPMWQRSRRYSENTEIDIEHILASTSIPIFFQPVKIGERFFGDGCLRNMAPLSPAIHLGADKILVIGVQKKRGESSEKYSEAFKPSFARIFSVMISAIFFDATDMDVERLSRINQTLKIISNESREETTLRPIDFVWIRPSSDIAQIALEESRNLPKGIRYFLSGLGSMEEAAELISYLLFEPGFCSRLVDLGYQDTIRDKQLLVEFFS